MDKGAAAEGLFVVVEKIGGAVHQLPGNSAGYSLYIRLGARIEL